MNKIKAQNLHAIRRAKQRYGVDLRVDDLKQIANKVRRGKSAFIGKPTLRVAKHVVEHKGVSFLIAYDTNRHTVCSFLPSKKK